MLELAHGTIEQIAWEVIPDVAEVLVRERIRQIEADFETETLARGSHEGPSTRRRDELYRMPSVHPAAEQMAGTAGEGGSAHVKALAAELARNLAHVVDNVVLFEAVDSTHAVALRLADQVDREGLALHPTVVLAESQTEASAAATTAGRRPRAGCTSAGWHPWSRRTSSPACPCWRRRPPASPRGRGVEATGIKWPNDILVAERKLAGILVHARRGAVTRVTVSIGVNIAPITERVGARNGRRSRSPS